MAPKIGLALGSGGARGWAHIGILRALEEIGIPPDVVCGTSMGALVGATYVSGALDALEDFARALTQIRMGRMLDVNLASGGLIEGKHIVRLLRDFGVKPTFSEVSVPFVAVATDMAHGREMWLRSGKLVEAVRASIGIPGIFSPVWIEGRWLLDGGMSNPVPVSACRALGAEVIIAVNPNARHYLPQHGNGVAEAAPRYGIETVLSSAPVALQPLLRKYLGSTGKQTRTPPGYLTVLSTSIDVMTDHILRSRLAGDPPNVMVDLDLHDMTMLDFAKADQAIASGYDAIMNKADILERLR
ncbi:patatin-like phospholipase family protein [Roseovarius autotrophicus]|uniref:patatin-like phospholipase family protein n=1 Tax=Roseovarius autotrophicus TaxID=2824121 RepID=UPI001B371360|nr:patatin-like phospholipase family protein [Roseovarius autotrophicus]